VPGSRRSWCTLVVALALALVVPAASAKPPTFAHTITIVLENRGVDDIVGNPRAPFVNGTLMTQDAYATNLYVTTHNSPTAYYILVSGLTFAKGDGGTWAGSCATATAVCSTDADSLLAQTRAAGRVWKVYSEDQRTPCQTTTVAKYWPNHNPAIFFRALGPSPYWPTGDGSCAQWDVPATELPVDIANGTLPDLVYLIPSNCDNMHDSCAPIHDAIAQGDAWLQAVLAGDRIVPGGLAAWAQANDTLILVTFDEATAADKQSCCPYAATGGGGHIPLWVIGPAGKVRGGGFHDDEFMNLFPLFKQLEENWSYPLLGHAADASVGDLSAFLIDQPTPPGVTLAPEAGTAAQAVHVAVAGFAPGEPVDVLWGCTSDGCDGATTLGSGVADTSGALALDVVLPADAAPGPALITARGESSGTTATAAFTLVTG
jgi:phosphatidylinositol-3-phosphatase